MAYDLTLGRLPDPTTTPAGPGFVTQEITPVDPGMLHPLNSGATVSVRYPGGSYWTIGLTYPEIDIAEGNVMGPFLYSLQGSFTNFYVSLPTLSNPQTGVWDVGTSIHQAANLLRTTANTTTLNIINWDLVSDSGNGISPGDALKIDNSHKIYYVVSTSYTAADFGTLSVVLNCDIINPTSLATSKLEMNDILFRVRSSATIPSLKLNSNGLYSSFSLSLQENIL